MVTIAMQIKKGNIVGSFHKVCGEIEQCQWGLHFCKNPLHCLNYYEPVQWNKFAKVNAYENIIEKDDKTVAQVIEIVEVYTFSEFIEEIKSCSNKNVGGYGIRRLWNK